ncbi:MAG: hypothetical protein ACLQPH_11175 [Acidimicrobiales bacterium]
MHEGALGATTDESAPLPGGDLPDVEEFAGAEVLDHLLADLHEQNLVFSAGYVGPDRRATGLRARLGRATFRQRRSLLRLELVVLGVVAVMVTASLLFIPSGAVSSRSAAVSDPGPGSSAPTQGASSAPTHTANPFSPTLPSATRPAAASSTTHQPTPTTVAAPSRAGATRSAPSAAAAPASPAPSPAPAAPPATTPTTAPPDVALTPQQMGAEALALVRYPWQDIPGYTIQFLPISDAPSPGFYGNTTFTWGQAGGTSDLYVYPGETVDELAGITAFEIGHEVDAAAVEPEGGETQIENVLGIHPASWAPDCDCAEQGFLSGWYAAAFSNYWSPGVGDWSQLASEPTGAVLAAVEPWFNPPIP